MLRSVEAQSSARRPHVSSTLLDRALAGRTIRRPCRATPRREHTERLKDRRAERLTRHRGTPGAMLAERPRAPRVGAMPARASSRPRRSGQYGEPASHAIERRQARCAERGHRGREARRTSLGVSRRSGGSRSWGEADVESSPHDEPRGEPQVAMKFHPASPGASIDGESITRTAPGDLLRRRVDAGDVGMAYTAEPFPLCRADAHPNDWRTEGRLQVGAATRSLTGRDQKPAAPRWMP